MYCVTPPDDGVNEQKRVGLVTKRGAVITITCVLALCRTLGARRIISLWLFGNLCLPVFDTSSRTSSHLLCWMVLRRIRTHPFLFLVTQGARVHRDPWLLLLLPANGIVPATFASSFWHPPVIRPSIESIHQKVCSHTRLLPSGASAFCLVLAVACYRNVPATSMFLLWSPSPFLIRYVLLPITMVCNHRFRTKDRPIYGRSTLEGWSFWVAFQEKRHS